MCAYVQARVSLQFLPGAVYGKLFFVVGGGVRVCRCRCHWDVVVAALHLDQRCHRGVID